MSHNHLISLFAIVTGAIMAVATRIADAASSTSFIQSLIIAVVSGLLTGSALIFSAWITNKRTDERVSKLDTGIEDVKSKLGAAKRRTDAIDIERSES